MTTIPHPQPLETGTALRGAYREEFFRCLRERAAYQQKAIKIRKHALEGKLDEKNLHKATEEACNYVQRLFDFAIRELQQCDTIRVEMLEKIFDKGVATIDTGKFTPDLPGLPVNIEYMLLHDSMSNVYFNRWMEDDFHACVALQNNTQSAHMATIARDSEMAYASSMEMLESFTMRGGQEEFLLHLAVGLLMQKELIEKRRARNSAVAAFDNADYSEIKECGVDRFVACVNKAHGLDARSNAGWVESEKLQKKYLREASQITGVPLPRGMGV